MERFCDGLGFLWGLERPGVRLIFRWFRGEGIGGIRGLVVDQLKGVVVAWWAGEIGVVRTC